MSRSNLATQVVDAIRCVVGPGSVALHEPRFGGNELEYLRECLDSTYVSSIGPFVDRFEAELSRYTGAGYAIATMNGTAALHVALLVSGVQSGDEVLVPALTFVATASAVAYCGAIPHFVESDGRRLGIDPLATRAYLERIAELRSDVCVNRATGRVIRAIVPMHVFGHPVDMDAVLSLAGEFRLAVVEDAAESLGSWLKGRHTGTFGKVGTLSFNGNKTITTGGGGAVLCDDADLARRAKHLSTTAKLPHRWDFIHDEVGYNYRMPNLNAALGCAQLERLPALLDAKRILFERYAEAFGGISGVTLLREPPGCRSNYWLNTLLLDEDLGSERDAILEHSNAAGLMTRPTWRLMHMLKPYAACPRMDLPVAESIARRAVNIPSSAHLAAGPQ